MRLFAFLSLFVAGCTTASASIRHAAPDAPLFAQPWQWSDESGRAVTFDAYRGEPMLIAMFYRACTVRCPMTVEKLRRIEAKLLARGVKSSFVMVSLDPHNDPPDRLAAFKRAQAIPEASWHLLTGADADTRALAKYLGIRPSYDVSRIDHGVVIAVFDRDGRRTQTLHGWTFDEDEVALGNP